MHSFRLLTTLFGNLVGTRESLAYVIYVNNKQIGYFVAAKQRARNSLETPGNTHLRHLRHQFDQYVDRHSNTAP